LEVDVREPKHSSASSCGSWYTGSVILRILFGPREIVNQAGI
jgi:hypothetical protein